MERQSSMNAAVQAFLAKSQRALALALERPLPRYFLAFVIFLLALLVRLWIFPLGAGFAFFTFYPAAVLAALLCGTGPAVAEILLSSIVIDYILIPPAWEITLTHAALSSIGFYVVSCLLMCLMIQRSRQGETERRLLSAIVRSADVAVLSMTLDGIITTWNPQAEKLLGYSREEILGKPVHILLPPNRIAEEAELLNRIGHGESVSGYDTFRIRKDGSRVDVSVTLSPIQDRFGRIAGASSIVHDITHRLALEKGLRKTNRDMEDTVAELRRSNKELDDFSYIASHDMKEPLRGIHNYVSFLREDYVELLDDNGRNYLDRLQRLAERMTALIDALLDLSRLGSTALPKETVDLDRVLDEVIEDVKVSLSNSGVEIRRAGRLPSVKGNALRIREVFQNLIVNAAKYNDKQEKWVEIGCDTKGIVPVCYVRDNGIGIPPQHRENVFRIFKRLHEQSKYGGGTGAGLTIVKKIVERHGGHIWLESAEGEGTTFYFTLAETQREN
jgi:PAS domain S-box-containing protein